MIDIVDRLRFDAMRCEVQFSKGVAGNITAGANEIERLRKAVRDAHALIDNDLVIPWIIANKLDDVLGLNQQLRDRK